MARPKTATLRPVLVEVVRPSGPNRRKSSYAWVRGYEVIAPNGRAQFPHMRKREARDYCRARGWRCEVL